MAQPIFGPDTTPANGDLDVAFTELYSKTAWSTTGIGYAVGAGGAVTQITSKSTPVTLNKRCGVITTHTSSLGPGGIVYFIVSNSLVRPTDFVGVNINGPSGGLYEANVSFKGTGQFQIMLRNSSTSGAAAEAVQISFTVVTGETT